MRGFFSVISGRVMNRSLKSGEVLNPLRLGQQRTVLNAALIGLVIGSAAFPVWAQSAPPTSSHMPANVAVVAKVNGKPIYQPRFDSLLASYLANGGVDGPQLRQVIRGELIVQELLRQEAAKKNLQNDPQVQTARDEAVRQAMIQRYLQLALKPEPVTETAVRARFDAIVATLGEFEYKPRIIALNSLEDAQGALAKIRRNEASFADIARQVSVLPSGASGGELDWVSFRVPAVEGLTQGIPLPIASALAALPPKGIASEPIVIDGRYYLLQLDERRPTTVPRYEDAATGIRRALEAQALERATAVLMGRLMNNARIE